LKTRHANVGQFALDTSGRSPATHAGASARLATSENVSAIANEVRDMFTSNPIVTSLVTVLLVASSTCTHAGTKIAVLDFELNDLSLRPGMPMELQRTHAVGPMLRDALLKDSDYQLVLVTPASQQRANAGAGYLAAHPDSAAELGREFGADWIIVGRLQKSNDLFAYLTVDLVNSRTKRCIGEFYTEIKGPIRNAKLTERGVQHLARQLERAIAHSAERPPNLINH
jgi:hypothetical protein